MEHRGIRLYPEADKFDNTCGILLTYLVPPNKLEADAFTDVARRLILAFRDTQIRSVKSKPEGLAGSVQQKSRNYTIHFIKTAAHRYMKSTRKRLAKNVWKP